MDSSGYQGSIRVVVYLVYPTIQDKLKRYNIGTNDNTTVYIAKLRTIKIALEIIKERFNDS